MLREAIQVEFFEQFGFLAAGRLQKIGGFHRESLGDETRAKVAQAPFERNRAE
jgi:hypothetical protein